MTATSDLLKTGFQDLDLHDVLRKSPTALLGVDDQAGEALKTLQIQTVFDLALSEVFHNAETLLKSGEDPGSTLASFGSAPAGVLNGSANGVAVAALPLWG